MSRHTPGPWTFHWDEDDGHSIRMGDAIDSPGQYASHHIWKCDHLIDPDGGPVQEKQFAQAEANAQLMANAPQMLEALILARRAFSQMGTKGAASDAVRAAIKRAVAK